jgi:hypothetical protein
MSRWTNSQQVRAGLTRKKAEADSETAAEAEKTTRAAIINETAMVAAEAVTVAVTTNAANADYPQESPITGQYFIHATGSTTRIRANEERTGRNVLL